jgi:3-dehydroquinate dehydratase
MNGYIMLGEMVEMTIKDLDIELKDFRGSDHEKELIERILNQLNSMIISKAITINSAIRHRFIEPNRYYSQKVMSHREY